MASTQGLHRTNLDTLLNMLLFAIERLVQLRCAAAGGRGRINDWWKCHFTGLHSRVCTSTYLAYASQADNDFMIELIPKTLSRSILNLDGKTSKKTIRQQVRLLPGSSCHTPLHWNSTKQNNSEPLCRSSILTLEILGRITSACKFLGDASGEYFDSV